MAAKAAFGAEVDDLVILQGLADEAADLATALGDAVAAIENSPEDAVAPGLGIDIVGAAAGVVNMEEAGASQNDLYFAQLEDLTAELTLTVNNFGGDGVDRIFVGGGDTYSFVELAEGEAMTDNVGNVAQLEIFAEQVDADVILYVEQVASAGNGSTAPADNADIAVVTLTGVDLAQLSFADDILSADSALAPV